MAFFAIQLARVVIASLNELLGAQTPLSLQIAYGFVISIHRALNVIKYLFIFYFFCFTDDVYLSRALHQQ